MLCDLRERDKNFVPALLEAGLVDAELIAARLPAGFERFRPGAECAEQWLTGAAK